jgi:hypothetical protein
MIRSRARVWMNKVINVCECDIGEDNGHDLEEAYDGVR